MVTEKQEVVEQVVETLSVPIEDITSIKAQLAAKEVELEQTKKGLSTAHQTLTQKDKELKSQSDLRTDLKGEIASLRDDLELAVTAFATRQNSEGNPDNTVVADTLAELAKKRDARESTRRAQEAGNILSAYQQRVAALGLTEEDESYWDIYRTARTLDPVDLKLADIKLKKLEALKIASLEGRREVKVETPKETDEVRVARLVREQLSKDYPDLYKSDTGSPGGSMSSDTEAMLKYTRGELSDEEARKYFD